MRLVTVLGGMVQNRGIMTEDRETKQSTESCEKFVPEAERGRLMGLVLQGGHLFWK